MTLSLIAARMLAAIAVNVSDPASCSHLYTFTGMCVLAHFYETQDLVPLDKSNYARVAVDKCA